VEDEEEEEVAVEVKEKEEMIELVAPAPSVEDSSRPVALIKAQQQQTHGQEHSRIPLTELVRRNAEREYEGLLRQELEVYLRDEEFKAAFRVDRERFSELPLWRQKSFKRSVGLF